MSLLTIYRVEDALTKGPYQAQAHRTTNQNHLSHELARRHSDGWGLWDHTVQTHPHIHPGPDDDLGMQVRWRGIAWSDRRSARHYNFGFNSTDRLGQWFFGERDTLELLNMHVAAYEVPHQAVIRGQWQVAFRRPSARLIETLPLAGLVD